MDMSTSVDLKPEEAVAFGSDLAASSAGAALLLFYMLPLLLCQPLLQLLVFWQQLWQLLDYDRLGRGQLLVSWNLSFCPRHTRGLA